MARVHATENDDVPFTEEEETARDVEEAAYEAAEPARAMARLRMKRNVLLAESDWTQYTDSPLGDKTSWATYRQELRDLPATIDDPDVVVWPEAPE